MELDYTTRRVPDTMIANGEWHNVNGVVAYPPGQHPAGCPANAEWTALHIQLAGGHSRWQAVRQARINSRLEMAVRGYSANDERLRAWPETTW